MGRVWAGHLSEISERARASSRSCYGLVCANGGGSWNRLSLGQKRPVVIFCLLRGTPLLRSDIKMEGAGAHQSWDENDSRPNMKTNEN
jgi:hypothetical protein